MLSNKNRTTSAMKTVSGSLKLLKLVIGTALSILDRFLSDSYNALIGSEFCMDFRKPGQTNRLNGFFTGTGIAEMPEGSDFDAVDIAFPFSVQSLTNNFVS